MARPEIHTPPTLSYSDERTFTSVLRVRRGVVIEHVDDLIADIYRST